LKSFSAKEAILSNKITSIALYTCIIQRDVPVSKQMKLSFLLHEFSKVVRTESCEQYRAWRGISTNLFLYPCSSTHPHNPRVVIVWISSAVGARLWLVVGVLRCYSTRR